MVTSMRSHRFYERQIDKLLGIIEKQNDRLMYLAGRTWETPPAREDDREQNLALRGMIDRYATSPSDILEDDF